MRSDSLQALIEHGIVRPSEHEAVQAGLEKARHELEDLHHA